MAVVTLLVPSFSLGMLTAPVADLIVIAGLLALARAVLSLAALDAGSAPGSIAAIAILRGGALAEPALLVLVLILALLTGSTNLSAALTGLRDSPASGASLVLAVAGFAVIVAAGEAEAEPIPDGLSGWHLAAFEAGVALRRVIGLSLLAALLMPASLAPPGFDALAWALALLAWTVKLLLLGAACALSGHAVRRMMLHTAMLGAGLLLMLLGLLFLLAGGELA